MAKRTHRMATLALLAMTGGFASVAGAQNLDMQGTAGARQDDGRPTRGMTQARVESVYGAPQSRVAPVGDPPIERWEYADFVVFFEYDRVIHAVRRR
jgi:hypothetical protein